MKPNIPKLVTQRRTDWSPLVRSFLMPVALVLGFALACLFLVASAAKSRPSASSLHPATRSVLMVGDSLSVSKFGEVVRDFLVSTFGSKNVAVYASCGSSPENWLRSEPTFFTKCGYREQTPKRSIVLERLARLVATPKLEDLLALHRPRTLIVQLGTNWMDRLVSGNPAKEAEMSSVLDRFVRAARGQPGTVRQIVWITPPDSSHFSQRVQRTVEALVRNAARKDNFETINSREITHYISGKTGGDGIHYNAESSTEWASRVNQRLNRKFQAWVIVP